VGESWSESHGGSAGDKRSQDLAPYAWGNGRPTHGRRDGARNLPEAVQSPARIAAVTSLSPAQYCQDDKRNRYGVAGIRANLEWAKAVLNTLEKSRNIVMHGGVLAKEDIERIGMNVRDWVRQTG